MLTYDLTKRGEQPLYEYLYESVRADIVSGALRAGERLPSKRKLAQHLSVSVITVEEAYNQLIAEGYIRSVERRGYYVNSIAVTPEGRDGRTPVRELTEAGRRAAGVHVEQGQDLDALLPAVCPTGKSANSKGAPDSDDDTPIAIDLTGRQPAQGLFPYSRWAFHVRKVLTDADEKALVAESGPFGSLALRHAIADFLQGYRGMRVDPGNIVVGAGSQVLYQLIVQLIGRDRRYALENPGYGRLARIYQANDVSVAPVPLDEQGIGMDALRASGASVAHVMPTHQYPTGQITSIARRYELLAWASQSDDRYIIEDDHDSELQFSGRPVPSLQSIDAQQKVIYLNTFAKSLGPAFRLSYMVLPDRLARQFRNRLGFYSCTANAIDQLALARFIDSGEYERHINRLRTHFRANATDLGQALKQAKPTGLALENAFAGSHCLLRLEGPASARAFAAAARKEGVLIRPLEDFLIGRPNMPDPQRAAYLESHLVLDYGALDETETDRCAELLQRARQHCWKP